MNCDPNDARGRRAPPKGQCGSAAFQPNLIGIDVSSLRSARKMAIQISSQTVRMTSISIYGNAGANGRWLRWKCMGKTV
jgi:hypothetical protein